MAAGCRFGAMPPRRLCACVVVGLLAAGCSIDYKVAGRFVNADEVFVGDVSHNLLAGTAHVVATGRRSGLTCRGDSRVTYQPPFSVTCVGQRGRVDMTCDDARRISVDWLATSCASGSGSGRDEFGNRFVFAFGLDPAAAERYVQKGRMMTRDRSALRNGAPKTPPPEGFPAAALALDYPQPTARPDDLAVIVANADYARGSLPDVVPAYADGESFRRYAIQGAGVPSENVVLLRDATAAELFLVFGGRDGAGGRLRDWIRPGVSRVHVYFVGHGATTRAGEVLVPVDAGRSMLPVEGYPLGLLYANLGALPAASVTVVLETSFPAAGGRKAEATPVPGNLTVALATRPGEAARWEPDATSSLFTKRFLLAMSGAADRAPHGDGDSNVGWEEVDTYLAATLGPGQTARIVAASGR